MRRIPALAVATAVVLAPLALAGAAHAAPDGITVYQLADSGGQLIDTHALTGVASTIGGAGSLDSSYGLDLDPGTGTLYAFNDSEPCELWSIDVATGVQTLVGEITGVSNCDGIDIPATGEIWVLSGDGVIYRVDPSDASILETVSISGIDGEVAFIATDPTTGTLWAGDYDTVLYTIDLATGIATAGPDLSAQLYVESADFDEYGTLWLATDGDACSQSLRSIRPTDADPLSTLSDFADVRDSVDSCFDGVYSVAIDGGIPLPVAPPEEEEPELAATGAGDAALIGGAALLLLLAGAVLATTRRLASRA